VQAVNVTVGAGIFVLPAAVAANLGAAAPAAYLICAVAMALVVTSFALAGSRVSLTGGIYAYVEVAFGPFVGVLAGTLAFTSGGSDEPVHTLPGGQTHIGELPAADTTMTDDDMGTTP